MRRAFRLSAFLTIVSIAAFAETWSGRLVDATCADQQKTEACVPTASTTAFALDASGKMLKLDPAGNAKASEALKGKDNNADRSKNPDRGITATVKGTLTADVIQVESIVVN
jgi:hypothetical protein